MACALPYHDTLRFVRLVQSARLAGAWAFLAPMQRSGAPLPRGTLVQRCCTDAALLERACRGAQQQAAVAGGNASAAWMSFYAVLLCEVLAAQPRVRPALCAWRQLSSRCR